MTQQVKMRNMTMGAFCLSTVCLLLLFFFACLIFCSVSFLYSFVSFGLFEWCDKHKRMYVRMSDSHFACSVAGCWLLLMCNAVSQMCVVCERMGNMATKPKVSANRITFELYGENGQSELLFDLYNTFFRFIQYCQSRYAMHTHTQTQATTHTTHTAAAAAEAFG